MDYGTETFQSFLEDVANATAKEHDARLALEATQELVSVASRALQTDEERDLLEKRREEIQRKVEALVTFIATDFTGYNRSGVITYRTFREGLAEFCRRHPDAYPLCPYP